MLTESIEKILEKLFQSNSEHASLLVKSRMSLKNNRKWLQEILSIIESEAQYRWDNLINEINFFSSCCQLLIVLLPDVRYFRQVQNNIILITPSQLLAPFLHLLRILNKNNGQKFFEQVCEADIFGAQIRVDAILELHQLLSLTKQKIEQKNFQPLSKPSYYKDKFIECCNDMLDELKKYHWYFRKQTNIKFIFSPAPFDVRHLTLAARKTYSEQAIFPSKENLPSIATPVPTQNTQRLSYIASAAPTQNTASASSTTSDLFLYNIRPQALAKVTIQLQYFENIPYSTVERLEDFYYSLSYTCDFVYQQSVLLSDEYIGIKTGRRIKIGPRIFPTSINPNNTILTTGAHPQKNLIFFLQSNGIILGINEYLAVSYQINVGIFLLGCKEIFLSANVNYSNESYLAVAGNDTIFCFIRYPYGNPADKHYKDFFGLFELHQTQHEYVCVQHCLIDSEPGIKVTAWFIENNWLICKTFFNEKQHPLVFFKLNNNKLLETNIPIRQGEIYAVSNNGKFIAVIDKCPITIFKFEIINLETGKQITIPIPFTINAEQRKNLVCFSPDNTIIFLLDQTSNLTCLSAFFIENGNCLFSETLPRIFYELNFKSDHNLYASSKEGIYLINYPDSGKQEAPLRRFPSESLGFNMIENTSIQASHPIQLSTKNTPIQTSTPVQLSHVFAPPAIKCTHSFSQTTTKLPTFTNMFPTSASLASANSAPYSNTTTKFTLQLKTFQTSPWFSEPLQDFYYSLSYTCNFIYQQSILLPDDHIGIKTGRRIKIGPRIFPTSENPENTILAIAAHPTKNLVFFLQSNGIILGINEHIAVSYQINVDIFLTRYNKKFLDVNINHSNESYLAVAGNDTIFCFIRYPYGNPADKHYKDFFGLFELHQTQHEYVCVQHCLIDSEPGIKVTAWFREDQLLVCKTFFNIKNHPLEFFHIINNSLAKVEMSNQYGEPYAISNNGKLLIVINKKDFLPLSLTIINLETSSQLNILIPSHIAVEKSKSLVCFAPTNDKVFLLTQTIHSSYLSAFSINSGNCLFSELLLPEADIFDLNFKFDNKLYASSPEGVWLISLKI